MLDQCIERWLCAGQNRAEINLWETIPCCPGMGLHDEGLAVLRAKMLEMGGPVVSSDVSGFDWQVTEAMLLDDVRLRVALAGCEPGCAYDRVLRSRVRCLSRSVIVLSDGTVVHQKRYGVQKSGSYNTSSTNSHMRAALAYMSGSNAAITMGDDCVEAPAHGAEEWYARYFPLKTPYRPTKQAEFCSIIFDLERGAGDPKCYMNSRIQKQLATLLDKKPQTPEAQLELVEAFHQNARHPGGFPDIADLWDFLVRVGWVQWENQLN